MGYGRKIYAAAEAELKKRRDKAERTAQERLEDFYEICPQARKVRQDMAANSARIAKAVMQGGDVRQALEKIRDNGIKMQEEFTRLLAENGMTQKDVTPQYTCPLCKDTGFQDGKMCSCLKELQRDLAYQKLSLKVPLSRCTFEAFSLDYYKDDPKDLEQMEKIFQMCKRYAQNFHANSSSLLFTGGNGLGKTHLSLAIAREVIAKGYGVIYGAAQTFAVQLEKERFDRTDTETEESTSGQLLSCDLLILDDLGTEFPSAYVNAALYNILDSRMLAQRPTIISTNLSFSELEKRYSSRLISRIMGEYGRAVFVGKDIRYRKRMERYNRLGGSHGTQV